jgi:hypothetical protein
VISGDLNRRRPVSDAAFDQQLLDISVRQAITQISTDR